MPTRRDTTATPVVSDELFAPVGNEVELCYQTFGDPEDEPLLLVMGLGGPMTWWDTELCLMLADAGFYVVRYDNRDTGRSTRIRARVTRGQLVRAFGGGKARAPYSMSDLAGDAVALMDHLGLESAHVAGISMGGMIAQTVAVEHPTRVRSLTSIMSTTGDAPSAGRTRGSSRRSSPRASPAATPTSRPASAFWDVIGSPG